MLIMADSEKDKIQKIFDTTFKTMVENNYDLLLHFLNEMFRTNYKGNEKIIPLANEHIISEMAKTLDKTPAFKRREASSILLTDSYFEVLDNNGEKRYYHIECQSNPDSAMTVRMFQYSSLIASAGSEVKDGIRHFYFPNSGILYLRDGDSNKEITSFAIHNSDGDVLYQKIHNVHVKNYSRNDIIDKKLLFVAPYYLMRYEKEISSPSCKKEEKEKYVYELQSLCREVAEQANSSDISDKTKFDLYQYIGSVAQYIARKNSDVFVKVGNIMNDIILESPSDRFIRETRLEFEEQARVLAETQRALAEAQKEREKAQKEREKAQKELDEIQKALAEAQENVQNKDNIISVLRKQVAKFEHFFSGDGR